RRVGAGTLAPFPAGTRYVRVYVRLQANAALTADYAYADDLQFQQLKSSTSGLLTLDTNYASNVVAANNNTVVQQVHCTLNLTLTEPGYVWAFANSMLSNSIARTNALLCFLTAGGSTIALAYAGEPVINNIVPLTLAGRSAAISAAGVQAVNFTFAVVTAGDVGTCIRTYLSAFWHRSA
ncbi:MAG: hypothetical protein PHO41_10905, partial [Eubacteriales bacterium]|nr:hypothetical protein [Eubacteriales bacterium]